MNLISASETLMREHVTAQMSVSDYHVMTAGWVADHIDEYRPRLYPGASDSLNRYARERCVETRERDSIFHRQLGQWTFTLIKLREQNDSDLSLLLWCSDKIAGKAVGSAQATLTRQIEKFMSLSFPYESYGLALRAQAKDMDAKQREEGIRR